ncbi:MAG: hypothetical protein HC915_00850 [Anaerolineae bacterium]|nr:hypothetical protein [Anaerolineae bacterium]
MHWREATQGLLAPLATRARVGVITDMDGTLSPIVAQPDAAEVPALHRDLLNQLCAYTQVVAVVSGRAAVDIQARLGLACVHYVGTTAWNAGKAGKPKPLLPEIALYRPAPGADPLPGSGHRNAAIRGRLPDCSRVYRNPEPDRPNDDPQRPDRYHDH